MERGILSSSEFAAFAGKHLVLVEVDFPMKKRQSAELKKSNEQLRDKFKVDGYPTLLVLNAKGEKLGEVENYVGKKEEFIGEIKEIIKKGSK